MLCNPEVKKTEIWGPKCIIYLMKFVYTKTEKTDRGLEELLYLFKIIIFNTSRGEIYEQRRNFEIIWLNFL